MSGITEREIVQYLINCDAICGTVWTKDGEEVLDGIPTGAQPCAILLTPKKHPSDKSVKVSPLSDKYVDWRFLNDKDENGEFVHKDFLKKVAEEVAIRLHTNGIEINIVVGILTTGATIAKFIAEAIEAEYAIIDKLENDNALTVVKTGLRPDLKGRNILIVDDLITSGENISRVTDVCETNCGNVIIALGLARRDKRVKAKECGLHSWQQLWTLTDLGFEDAKVEYPTLSGSWEDSTIFQAAADGELTICLDKGHAAKNGWGPEGKYSQLNYTGEPKEKAVVV